MTSRVQDYLSRRRALGYKLYREGRQLLNFARYADRARHRGPLSAALALRWATLPRGCGSGLSCPAFEHCPGFCPSPGRA